MARGYYQPQPVPQAPGNQAVFISQFNPIPMDFIQDRLNKKELQFQQGYAMPGVVESDYSNADVLGDYKEGVENVMDQTMKTVDQLVEEAGGDWGMAAPVIARTLEPARRKIQTAKKFTEGYRESDKLRTQMQPKGLLAYRDAEGNIVDPRMMGTIDAEGNVVENPYYNQFYTQDVVGNYIDNQFVKAINDRITTGNLKEGDVDGMLERWSYKGMSDKTAVKYMDGILDNESLAKAANDMPGLFVAATNQPPKPFEEWTEEDRRKVRQYLISDVMQKTRPQSNVKDLQDPNARRGGLGTVPGDLGVQSKTVVTDNDAYDKKTVRENIDNVINSANEDGSIDLASTPSVIGTNLDYYNVDLETARENGYKGDIVDLRTDNDYIATWESLETKAKEKGTTWFRQAMNDYSGLYEEIKEGGGTDVDFMVALDTHIDNMSKIKNKIYMPTYEKDGEFTESFKDALLSSPDANIKLTQLSGKKDGSYLEHEDRAIWWGTKSAKLTNLVDGITGVQFQPLEGRFLITTRGGNNDGKIKTYELGIDQIQQSDNVKTLVKEAEDVSNLFKEGKDKTITGRQQQFNMGEESIIAEPVYTGEFKNGRYTIVRRFKDPKTGELYTNEDGKILRQSLGLDKFYEETAARVFNIFNPAQKTD